jgi:hypothetical protein
MPFSAALVAKCVVNIVTDTIAVVSTAMQLDAQLDENDKVAALIGILASYKAESLINYTQIQTYYNTIKAKLAEYKNSTDPAARVASSAAVAQTDILMIDLISENC